MFNKNIYAGLMGALIMLCIVIWAGYFYVRAENRSDGAQQKRLIARAIDIISENYVDPLTEEDRKTPGLCRYGNGGKFRRPLFLLL